MTFILLIALGGGPALDASAQARFVDLDAPGALDALARENRQHHRKVREVMDEAQRHPGSEVPEWMRTRLGVKDVTYGPLLLVTDPPKRRLSFRIDEVFYSSTVTVATPKTR